MATMFAKDKHMGHFLIDCLKRRPDAVCQIDAATGEEETNASVLERSIQLARCLRKLDFLPGDVLAVSGRNHLDVHIPFYAGLMNGLPVAGIDPSRVIHELKEIFRLTQPKVAFCEPESYDDYVNTARDLGLNTRVFTFGKGEHSMEELFHIYRDDTPIEEFEVATFDTDKIHAWLVGTGGSTQVIKVVAIKHEAWKQKMHNVLTSIFGTTLPDKSDVPHKPALLLSSIQWISGPMSALGMPLLHQTKVQTSKVPTTEHVIDIINKYKPVTAIINPNLASNILQHEQHCDLTCFENIVLTGRKVFNDVLVGLRERVNKKAVVFELYGQSENLGPVFAPNPFGPVGNCGRLIPGVQTKLMDPDTGNEITEPHVTGEIWTRGLGFSCYYNDPKATAEVFTEDGWFKTGDLLYHDENMNYFFVDRMKMLIKYRNHRITPLELEGVIRSHGGVQDVSVTRIPDADDGEYPVACVVRRPGSTVTAQEIKDLVASTLSDEKRLRGGVVFLKQLPATYAGKAALLQLQSLVLNMPRE